jgi:hypothetical protein
MRPIVIDRRPSSGEGRRGNEKEISLQKDGPKISWNVVESILTSQQQRASPETTAASNDPLSTVMVEDGDLL